MIPVPLFGEEVRIPSVGPPRRVIGGVRLLLNGIGSEIYYFRFDSRLVGEGDG
jgi:hypothetical protein